MAVNLHKELIKTRKKSNDESKILAAVFQILHQHETDRENILASLSAENAGDGNDFVFDHLETDKIFHIDQIQKTAIDYRLRFLESHRFKNGFPEEVIVEIKKLETIHGTKLTNFMVMAPTNAFKLDNYDDPLLFASIGNDYYYLVHKWGKEFSNLRKFEVLPFKNLGWFTFFSLVVSIFLTAILPLSRLAVNVPMAKFIIFLFVFKSVIAVGLYGFFMGGRKFSDGMWNSRFYNN